MGRTKGRFVWSSGSRRRNASGITEALLDAETGKILSVKKERAAVEANEARAERKKN